MNSSTSTSANSKGDVPNPFQSPPHRAVLTLFHCLAIVFTIARLTRRIRIRKFSWDDAWAGVCLALIVIYVAVSWTKLKVANERQPVDLNRLGMLYKVNLAMYTAIVWFSRVSLSLSIARIFPEGRLRVTAIMLSIVCFVTGLTIIIGKTIVCSAPLRPSPAGTTPRLVCTKAIKALSMTQTVGDVFSSLALVIFPIRALFPSTSKLRPSERRLILVLLMSTTVTLAMGLATAIFISKGDTFRMILFSDLEASVSLMVCNFLVVITNGWRLLSQWFSQSKSRGQEQMEDRHGAVYNTGEDPLSISTGRGLSSGDVTYNSDSTIISRRMNTTTTPRSSMISVLTDIAEYSFKSMELVMVGQRSDNDSSHPNGRESSGPGVDIISS